MYNFKDERITFCLNIYAKTSLGADSLKNILNLIPKQVFESIDKCQNLCIKNGSEKISLNFISNQFSGSYDAFEISIQSGKYYTNLKLFYSNFDSNIIKESNISKTILFIEQRKQKNIFSASKRTYSQYAFLTKSQFDYNISFIEDMHSKVSKHYSTINISPEEIHKLKSKQQYQSLGSRVAN